MTEDRRQRTDDGGQNSEVGPVVVRWGGTSVCARLRRDKMPRLKMGPSTNSGETESEKRN